MGLPHPTPTTRSPAEHGPTPTEPTQREPVLDVLRGAALLGILLVNVELLRGPVFYELFAASEAHEPSTADEVARFAVGWLATSKLMSALAVLFGVGAALMVARGRRRGGAPRRLLARRYALLLVFGLAHMLLLFPGDILFTYGLAGLALLAFVGVRARTALWWGGGLLAVSLTGALAFVLGGAGADPSQAVADATFVEARRDAAVAAFTDGSFADVVAVNAFEALFTQTAQLLLLPWVLALFLVGFAIGQGGILSDLAGARHHLRRAALIGLGVGVPLNLPLGLQGPLALSHTLQPGGEITASKLAAVGALVVGAPLLAVGYLAGLALLCLRWRPIRPLAAVGQMALSAYLLQSLLALLAFAGLNLYGAVTFPQALTLVAAVWITLLVACPAWLQRFRYGPAEWLWRTAVYGHTT